MKMKRLCRAGVAIALLGFVSCGASASLHDGTRATIISPYRAGPPPGPHAFPGSIPSTLDGITSELAYPILRPHDPLADDETVTNVFLDEANARVEIQYASGIHLLLDETDPVNDPEPSDAQDLFSRIVEQEGGARGPFSVENIHGVPALVAKPKFGGTSIQSVSVDAQSNHADITMFLQGIRVEIYGAGPLDSLVRVANSIS
jgi:hypothetical protein